ncbi:MAG: molybdenum cofactor guanylyltransferase [archaeon GBS-70-058]|nr:molybdenum cofactor guanylyltransferase [Candidatus Culexarchaeum nevadense]
MDVTLIVLAGGTGNRIGVYKPILKLKNLTLIENVLKNLMGEFNQVVIVLKEEWQRELLESTCEILRRGNFTYTYDPPNLEGLLAAIYAGTLIAVNENIAIAPSDTPFIKPHTYEKMYRYLDYGYEAVVPRWPNGFIEPLVSMYAKTPLLKVLESKIAHGEKSVRSILDSMKTLYVDVYDVSLKPEIEFLNVNTIEDLMLAEKLI